MTQTWAEKEQNMMAILSVANSMDPPTYAVLAQARIESDYDLTAYNDSSGAVGLFQIKPSTIEQPGFGVTPGSVMDLRDAARSTQWACSYLTALYMRKRSWALAFLHYNVGPEADPATASAAYKTLASLVATVEGEEVSW